MNTYYKIKFYTWKKFSKEFRLESKNFTDRIHIWKSEYFESLEKNEEFSADLVNENLWERRICANWKVHPWLV